MYPILFRLGTVPIYSYGFFIALGFAAGFVISALRARRVGVPLERMADLFFWAFLSSFVGSRLLFVVLHLDRYRENPLRMLHLEEGGLVFYGGLVLAAAVCLWIMRHHRLPVWRLADVFAPPIALGLFFGRIGCFLAGCCYGKETALPWGVTFTRPESLARLNVPLHPTQLYDAVNGLALFSFLVWVEKRKGFEGQIFWLLLLLYAVTRFFIEMFRGDPRGFLLGDRLSTSQGIGILLAILSLFMLFYQKKAGRG